MDHSGGFPLPLDSVLLCVMKDHIDNVMSVFRHVEFIDHTSKETALDKVSGEKFDSLKQELHQCKTQLNEQVI